MPRNILKDAAGAVASNLAIVQGARLSVPAKGRDVALELYTSGGGAVVAIQAQNLAGVWETLALDDGATTVTLVAGTPVTVHVALPVENLGVLVSNVTGSPLLTAATVSRDLWFRV